MSPTDDDFSQMFAPEPPLLTQPPCDNPWQVLLVDDEADIHAVLRLALQDVVIEGRGLALLVAGSAAEAKVSLSAHPDIAVILLDVVMETEQAGLDLVRHIREVLGKHNVQIVLVTGQPGYAPQRKVVADYAIDGYRLKSELTSEKIFVSICTALRNYRALRELERQRQQLATQAEILRESEERLQSVTAAVPGVVYQFLRTPQGDWKFVYISKGIETLYEVSAEAAYLDHSALTDCVLAEDRTSYRESVERSAANLSSWQHEHRIKTPNGSLKWVRGEATPARQEGGGILWSGILTDITERKRVAQQLERSQERLQLALSGGELGLWDWHIASGEVLYSERWYAMLGLPMGEATSDLESWTKLIHPDDLAKVHAALESHLKGLTPAYDCEHRVRHHDGRWLWLHDRGRVVEWDKAGVPVRAVGTYMDITERKAMEDQIRQLAFHDPLTKLPNRRLLSDRLSQSMAANKRSGCYGALMFLDLDNFKPLNDAHGHDVGDLLLIEVADRLKSCVREMDTVARFGGDEFVVMIIELPADIADSTAQAETVAEKILSALSAPYRLTIAQQGKEDSMVTHHCTASIGVTLFVDHEATSDQVIMRADRAMYQAKEAGRNSIWFYGPNA